MPDTATLDADVILPNWSTIIEATLVAPPYVAATTAVFASPSETLPEDELAVSCPELANTDVLVTEVFDALRIRPCASTTRIGIAEELPWVPADTPVVVRFDEPMVLAAILAPVIVPSAISEAITVPSVIESAVILLSAIYFSLLSCVCAR